MVTSVSSVRVCVRVVLYGVSVEGVSVIVGVWGTTGDL